METERVSWEIREYTEILLRTSKLGDNNQLAAAVAMAWQGLGKQVVTTIRDPCLHHSAEQGNQAAEVLAQHEGY